MANRKVKEFAILLGISPEAFLTEVSKKLHGATMDSILNDESQSSLLERALQLPKESDISPHLQEMKSKMTLLYQYEKHYLELIKDYKEEIKFAASLQEDLRRERSQFFTQTLREVTQTLQAQDVDKKVASQWIEDLVASYTKSIDLSSDLAKTHVVQVLNIFKEEAKQEISKASLDNLNVESIQIQ